MFELPTPVHSQMIDLASTILERQEGNKLEDLRLNGLSLRDGAEKLSQEEDRLIGAISNSNLTMLRSFYIGENKEWFRESESRATLLDFIKR